MHYLPWIAIPIIQNILNLRHEPKFNHTLDATVHILQREAVPASLVSPSAALGGGLL